ncbi:MAG: Dipeptidyl aminopeptidase BIII [Chloroflexi bacterium]|nr:Dipeptidyl aminopeptidase BIII [Chloroflexota bacterium]
MIDQKTHKQYGLWPSPITPQEIGQGLDFSDVAWNDDGTLVWRERRSDRGLLIVQPPVGDAFRALNNTFSVSGGVGYGGGSFTVGDGCAYFVEKASKRIYAQPLGAGSPRPITPEFGAAAAPRVSPDGEHLLFIHTYENEDTLAVVDTEGEHWPRKLASGADFYMHPRWGPDGQHAAWVSWNHPNMPWDGTTLELATLTRTPGDLPALKTVTTIAGDETTSIFQPEFSPDGRYLAYVSDQSGWWQLYLYDLQSKEHRQLTDIPAEHGKPAWVQGMRTYSFGVNGEKLYFIRNQKGIATLWEIEIASGQEQQLPLEEEYTWFEQIAVSPQGGEIALLASGGRAPKRVIVYQPGEESTVLRRSTAENLSPEAYSTPQPLSWSSLDGETTHGLYYPPQNAEFTAEGPPPLVVLVHGGPTGQRVASYNPKVQFFTSRGYAVLQPNYRGSAGYGRDYRDALKGKWGIFDVADTVSGARYLAEEGLADTERMVVMGGSAGGFTVLIALEKHPGVFRAGISMYGVANHFTLAADTHKFEKRYLDSLLGPLPEAAEVYRERSPIFAADKIQDAMAIFQGEDDKVVPKDQSEAIVEALKRNGIPHEYHLYPGEGHGFRKSETLEHFYKSVDDFLREYVIFA